MKAREERAGLLYDFAVAHPAGFTNTEAMDEFGWSLRRFNEAVQTLRDILGNDDTISFVCSPQGQNEDWRYQLVGTYGDMRPWTTNRLIDAERRVITIGNVTGPIVRNSDGRTVEGKKARMINNFAHYMKAQFELLEIDE